MSTFIKYKTSDGCIIGMIQCAADVMRDFQVEGINIYEGEAPNATHIINNEPVTIIPEPIPPTEAEIIQRLTDAIQRHLDTTAKTRNYDGILSLCSYATSTDPVFAAEGQAGVNWRDACWRHSYQVMADVQAEIRTTPSPAEMVAELPAIGWT